MAAELRMFLNDQPASEEQLDLFRTIRVDQAIGMVTEAELEMELCLDANGKWVDFDEAFVEPFARIRVEAKAGDGGFVPLIDGPVIGQKIEMSAAPNDSTLTLVVHDDSVLLNRRETVAVFEDESASEIARRLFADAGLADTMIDDVPAAGGTLEHAIVQRGTAMHLLRELARRHGMFVYVAPGPRAGASIGVFRRPDLSPGDLPELVVVGENRNLDRLVIEFDGLRPFAAEASAVDAANLDVLDAAADASSQTTLGDEAVHELVEPATVLLARTRETDNDLDAAVAAAADYSSWAYSAQGEVDAAAYPGVLQPHGTVSVAGAGPASGLYLISRVTHLFDDQSYRQQFTLRRNARSGAAGGGSPLGGLF